MKIGETLAGRYELRSSLGTGGLGEVFVARDARSRRDVAVKVFDPARCPADRLRGVGALLAAASRVEHPALVLPKIQVALSERPPFVVGEWVEGEDLAGLLARERCIPWARGIALALSCAEGLAAVVTVAGKPHRALKPGNIRITTSGEARVLDYGVAELGNAEPPRPRRDGTFVEYRAPEQIQGAPVDARTDVFTLGVLLVEMLTGVHPFTGSTAHKAAWKVSMPAHSVQPSEFAAEMPLPSQVEKLLVRALARAPADRFKDLTDMAQHLALVLRSPGAPIRARGAAPPASAQVEDATQALPAIRSSEDMTTSISLPVLRLSQAATKPLAPIVVPATTLEPAEVTDMRVDSPPSIDPAGRSPASTPSPSPPRPPSSPTLADDARTEILPARRLPAASKDSTLVLASSPQESTLDLDAAPAPARLSNDTAIDDELTSPVVPFAKRRALAPEFGQIREVSASRTPLIAPAPAEPSEPRSTAAERPEAPAPEGPRVHARVLVWINAICITLIVLLAILFLVL